MLPLTYVKNTLVDLINYKGSDDLNFVRNINSLIDNEYIDESNAVGSILINIVKEIMQNKNIHEAVSSVIVADFSAEEIITSLKTQTLEPEDISQLRYIVNETINTINIMKNVKVIQEASMQILNKELKSSTEIKQKFQNIMSESINVLVKLDKNSAEDGIEISSNNIDNVVDKIKEFYMKERMVLCTGLNTFDEYLNGGLHSSRLYTVAMKSGDGKSTVMLGLSREIQKILKKGTVTYNMIEQKMQENYPGIEGTPTIYYFTFENSIDESLERYLPGIINKPINSIKDVENNIGEIKEKLSEFDVTLDMEYRGGFTTSPLHIIQYIEKEKVKGKFPVAIFVDYLGIMISDTQRTEKRLQLEEITAGLKNIAVMYNVPVMTGVQVKKDSFDKGELSLSDIKESSGIIDNSDVVISAWQGENLNLANSSQREMFMKIDKQRNYIKGVTIKLGVDFNTYSLFNISQFDDGSQSYGNVPLATTPSENNVIGSML